MKIKNNATINFEYVLPDGVQADTATSNEVETQNLTYALLKVKASNKTYLNEGEQAVQTITFTNNSDTTIKNLFFTDTLTSGGSFVTGSVKVDGVAKPEFCINTGFILDNIDANGSRVVEYQIKADDVKSQDYVENTATLTYGLTDPLAGELSFEERTNTVRVNLISTKLTIVKSVDRLYAIKGNVVKYTITITNTGSSAIQDITFTDEIPTGTTFVAESVTVNGTPNPTFNPATGFALPTMNKDDVTVVEFSVTVD